MELWLVRHGETDLNRAGVWQGQLDAPLSREGRAQATRLARRLARGSVAFDRLYASDLARARDTARILGEGLGLRVQEDSRLRELCVGELSGRPREEVFTAYAEVLARTRADPWNTRLPGGESLSDLRRRLLDFLAGLPPGRHLVVTHAGVIRVAIWLALGLTDGQPWRIRLANTSLTRVTFPEAPNAWTGEAGPVGDAAHLER